MLLKLILSLLAAIMLLMQTKTQASPCSFRSYSTMSESYRQLLDAASISSPWSSPGDSLWSVRRFSDALHTIEEITVLMDRLDPIVNKYQTWFQDGLECLNSPGTSDCVDTCGLLPSEDSTKYEATVEIPGYKKEDVQLSILNNVLYLNAEKPARSHGENTADPLPKHQLSRTFLIPGDADTNSVAAVLQDGVLVVSMAKQPLDQAQEEGKKIPIL